jgi:hypothetical protein
MDDLFPANAETDTYAKTVATPWALAIDAAKRLAREAWLNPWPRWSQY